MHITNEALDQIRVWAEGYKDRNAEALMEAEDFARIAEAKWARKARYYRPEKGSVEQFTGMICNNVEAELAETVIADRERRLVTDSLDKPLGKAGAIVDTLADACSRRERLWLRYDVREAVSLVRPKSLRRVLELVMDGYSVRELARDVYRLPRNTFVYALWEPAVKIFKKIFGQMR